jgi:photosynthetic reaction center H subunit
MPQTFGLTAHIDLALVVLYVFWAFFAGLIWYLHRENKREGYPLVTDRRDGRVSVVGYPVPPPPKTFLLPHGGSVTVPNDKREQRAIALRQTAGFAGAPYEPTGNPLVDGVGPASWAERADEPDLTIDGLPKIVPLRAAPAYHVADRDPNPIGWAVVGGDRGLAGTVVDVWVDQSEFLARYLEVEVPSAGGPRRVLLPLNFARLDPRRGEVTVRALYADQFAGVPGLANPNQVTLLEEDKITGYYGGGLLYATPARTEPLL